MSRPLTVSVIVKAINETTAPLRVVTQNFLAVREAVTRAKSALQLAGHMENAAAGMQRFADQARVVVEAPLRTAIDFESAMARVGAKTGASTDEVARLATRARDLGASTSFSALQVAGAMTELATAGMDAGKVYDAIPGMLDLAASGGLGLAEAAKVAGGTLNVFQLAATEAGRVADVLAMAADKSATNVTEVGDAVSYAGAGAVKFGLGVEQTSALLGVLADKMLKGERGGTALRAVFDSLSKPSELARKKLRQFGVATMDAQKNLRSPIAILRDLNAALANVGSGVRENTLGDIFATTGSGAAGYLMEGMANYETKLAEAMNARGWAAAQAKKSLDNVKGALEELGGATEELSIAAATPLLSVLKSLLGTMTSIVGAAARWAKEHPLLSSVVLGTFGAVAVLSGGLATLTLALAAAVTAYGYLGVAMGAGTSIVAVQELALKWLNVQYVALRVRALAMATANGTASFSFARLTFAMLGTALRAAPAAAASFARLAVSAVVGLVPALGTVATAFYSVGVAILTTPVGWILGAVALIAGAAYLVWKNWDALMSWWDNLSPRWRLAFVAAFPVIFAFIKLVGLIRANWEPIMGFFQNVGEFIADCWKTVAAVTLAPFVRMYTQVKAIIGSIQKLLEEFLETAAGKAFTSLLSSAGELADKWGGGLTLNTQSAEEGPLTAVARERIQAVNAMPWASPAAVLGPNRETLNGNATEVGGELKIKVETAPGLQATPMGVKQRGPMAVTAETGMLMWGVG